jgi:hypothetical protein
LGEKENKHIVFHKDPLLTCDSIADHSSEDSKKWMDFTTHIEKVNKILRKTLSTHSPQSARYWIVGCFVNEKSIGSTNRARTPRPCGPYEDCAYDDARAHG